MEKRIEQLETELKQLKLKLNSLESVIAITFAYQQAIDPQNDLRKVYEAVSTTSPETKETIDRLLTMKDAMDRSVDEAIDSVMTKNTVEQKSS